MHTNNMNGATQDSKIIYPDLSYKIVGICFDVSNKLGRYAKEVQYSDAIESRLKEINLQYIREFSIANTRNRLDFLIEDSIILELKAKSILTKDDYFQIQRYLQILNKKLGLLVNFRSRYLKPIRIVRIDTDARKKFLPSK